jgi:hypothetical protein
LSRKRAALAWLFLLATAFPAAPAGAADYPPEIIPAAAPWVFRSTHAQDELVLRIPDDLQRLNLLPRTQAQALRSQVERIERNREYIRKIGKRFAARGDLRRYRIKPDYEHRMKIAALSISHEDATAADPLWRHRPLIAALPDYTRIVLRAPAEAAAGVQAALGPAGLAGEVTVVSSQHGLAKNGSTSVSRPSRWIRDTFFVAHDSQGDDTALLLPPAYTRIDDLAGNDLTAFEHDRQWADRTLRLPIFIRGGNLHAAEARGRQVLFVGQREAIYHAEAFYFATRHRPPPSQFNDVLRAISGVDDADDIITLPNSHHLFHIDQVVMFPRPGIAGIIAPVDPEAVPESDLRVIRETRRLVEAAGFTVIDIPSSAARIAAYRSPVNAVAFLDWKTNRPTLLAPVFPDEKLLVEGRLQSLNRLVVEALERTGVDVIPVEDRFSERQGNTHCALLALE